MVHRYVFPVSHTGYACYNGNLHSFIVDEPYAVTDASGTVVTAYVCQKCLVRVDRSGRIVAGGVGSAPA